MIITAQPEHIGDLIDLQSSILGSEMPLSYGAWRERIENHAVYLNLEDGAAVGALVAVNDDSGDVKIDHVFTHPNHRRQGVARALMDQFIGMQEDRAKTAFLRVSPNNEGAISLYEAAGFHACSEVIEKYLTPSARALYEATGITQSHSLVMVREPEAALA